MRKWVSSASGFHYGGSTVTPLPSPVTKASMAELSFPTAHMALPGLPWINSCPNQFRGLPAAHWIGEGLTFISALTLPQLPM